MNVIITTIAILAGLAGIVALSSYSVGFALVCAPLVASVVIVLASTLRPARRPRRHGISVGA